MINRKIEIVNYNADWPYLFKQEANRIQELLGNELQEIHHIGSTAIPYMPGKPVIDIMLECDNLDVINFIAARLIQLNYFPIRRQIIPHRSFFTFREDKAMRYHLHIFERGDPQIKRHVNFRDYVSFHEEIAKEYALLKFKLAKEFSNNITAYVIGKAKLVQAIDAKAKVWPNRKKDYLPANTGSPIKHWTSEKLMKAMVANLNVHMTHFSQYLNQVDLIRVPGYTIVNSYLPDDTFNYIIDADFKSENALEKIAEITRYFRLKQTSYSWWISPYDQPENLSYYLENNCYQNTENNVAMYFDLDAWDGKPFATLPSLEIVRVTDAKSLEDFALVLTNDREAFETYFSWIAAILTDDDPIEYFVGYVNGKPVVRGLTCYYAQVAGLHWISTHPEERKKGYAAAMQYYRLKRAQELGYHVAVLQASKEGFPLYQKLGYKECGTFKEFKLI